jgi:hypothetical protein
MDPELVSLPAPHPEAGPRLPATLPPRAGSRAPFIDEFMGGSGRTPEFYDESWPANAAPLPAFATREKGPERALG